MRPASWSRRGWAVAGAAVVVVLLVAGGGVAVLASEVEEEPTAEPNPLPRVPEQLECPLPGDRATSPRIWEGEGEPDVALALDSHFSGRRLGEAEREAVRLVLERRGWRAGPWSVAFFACSSSLAHTWSQGWCEMNATRYAGNPSIVGVLAPFTSGCTLAALDAMAAKPGGGPAMVSSTNVWSCLTRWAAHRCADGDAATYRPARPPVYFRVSVPDLAQGAALAELAAREGWRRVYVLDDSAWGSDIADGFTSAARLLGVSVVGRASWVPRARDYRVLMRTVRRAGPDAVLLAGLVDENGPRVVRDKVAVLGPNEGRVKLFAPEGFFADYTIAASRGAAQGLYTSSGGLPAERLPVPGRALLAALRPRIGSSLFEEHEPFLVPRMAAAEALLDAIAASDGTRAGVLDALRSLRVRGGPIGDFGFDEHGDVTLRWVTVYVVEGGEFVPYRALNPDAALVEAAAGG